jgi:hypothetical protein
MIICIAPIFVVREHKTRPSTRPHCSPCSGGNDSFATAAMTNPLSCCLKGKTHSPTTNWRLFDIPSVQQPAFLLWLGPAFSSKLASSPQTHPLWGVVWCCFHRWSYLSCLWSSTCVCRFGSTPLALINVLVNSCFAIIGGRATGCCSLIWSSTRSFFIHACPSRKNVAKTCAVYAKTPND